MLGFATLTPTYLEHAARMRFGCDKSDFFRDDYLASRTWEIRRRDSLSLSGCQWLAQYLRVALEIVEGAALAWQDIQG